MESDRHGFVTISVRNKQTWFEISSTTHSFGTVVSRGALKAIFGAIESGCDMDIESFPGSETKIRVSSDMIALLVGGNNEMEAWSEFVVVKEQSVRAIEDWLSSQRKT